MAFQLTGTAKNLAAQINKQVQVILDIDGLDVLFGAIPVEKKFRYDDAVKYDEGARYDSSVTDSSGLPYISLNETTKSISQQIAADKGGTTSLSVMNIGLIDKNSAVSRLIAFDNTGEILSKKASVYLNFKGGSHPEDSLPIFRGFISGVDYSSGLIVLEISHPEKLKRQDILTQASTELTSRFVYKEKLVQDIYYEQRFKDDTVVSIEYVVAGSVSASISGSNITINILASGTFASDVLQAIDDNVEVANVIEGQIVGSDNTDQVAQGLTQFDIDTTVQVKSTGQIIPAQDTLHTYIRIDDEIMEVDSIDSDVQLTILPGQLGTLKKSHDTESELVSFYRLQGNPLDLACKIMLSNEGNTYEDIESGILAFNDIDATTSFQNSVVYEDYDIEESLGLTIGDDFQISGSISNDGDYTITDFGTFSGGSYITLDGNLITESVENVSTLYRSQFNVLSFGLGMLPNEVDVQAHLDLRDQQGANFVDYDLYVKEDVKAKDFLDTEIYYPQSLYSIPRRARVSVKLTQPPVTSEVTTTIDESICTNISDLKVKRSVDVYRYNEIIYNYNVDSIEDKFLKREILISQSSKARVKAGNKQFKIDSNGLRDNAETELVIRRASDRINDRYRFAAAAIKGLKLPYGFGYALEVGDVVPFGGPGVQINNGDTGERGLDIKLYEIINKTLSIGSGEVRIDLLETNFSNSARFAVIGLASNIENGSTDTELLVSDPFTSSDFASQGEKWLEFVGERVQIRDDDWSNLEIKTLEAVSTQNANKLILDSALSFTPGAGFVIEPLDYDDTSNELDADYKLKFTHINATANITAVTDTQTFEVDDGSKLIEGSTIYVHSLDYSTDSFGVDNVIIASVIGNDVILDKPLTVMPSISDQVEASDFADSGFPYLFI